LGYYTKLDGNTELAQAVDLMMVRAKIIYILIIKVNKLVSFLVTDFSERKRKHVVRASIKLLEPSLKFGRT